MTETWNLCFSYVLIQLFPSLLHADVALQSLVILAFGLFRGAEASVHIEVTCFIYVIHEACLTFHFVTFCFSANPKTLQ